MSDLTVAAPQGAHFEFEEVRTNKGTESLGLQPILVWDDLDAARQTYGDQGVLDVLDGTSVRVSMQSIARRGAMAKKTGDQIAEMQIAFKPGKRAGGASTPVSRAQRAAKGAAEKLGDGADTISALLEKIASGEISAETLKGLL
jgi:hypothetical protein